MDKYFYIRKNADVDNDDGIDDSIYVPVKNITGIVPIDATSLCIYFDSAVNQAGNVAEDLNVISDFIDLHEKILWMEFTLIHGIKTGGRD
jgi:hypothetical protein